MRSGRMQVFARLEAQRKRSFRSLKSPLYVKKDLSFFQLFAAYSVTLFTSNTITAANFFSKLTVIICTPALIFP